LAKVWARQGRLAEARKLHEETVRLKQRVLGATDPETLRSMNALAWLLATAADATLRDSARALELAKEVVGRAPQDADKWTTLGVAHYRAGQWSDAVAALEKSESLAPGKDVAANAFFLAMSHWQQGQKDRARQSYDIGAARMLKEMPDDPELRQFRAEAAQLMELKEKK
jgi:tetratricopeptide (TPR) repeat protein